jgi:hypothetical protein
MTREPRMSGEARGECGTADGSREPRCRRITRSGGPASTWTVPCACRVPAGLTAHDTWIPASTVLASGIRAARNTFLPQMSFIFIHRLRTPNTLHTVIRVGVRIRMTYTQKQLEAANLADTELLQLTACYNRAENRKFVHC